MKQIYDIILNENELNNILEINPFIKELNDEEIEEILTILKNIGCTDSQLKNIILCNPFFLNKCSDDILKLIKKLLSLKITNLNITFDTNPFILNKDVYEIEEFIEDKLNDGLNINDIIDIIDNGMLGE